jgi:DnaJ-class molecular chaperone
MKWRDLPRGYADRPDFLRGLPPHEVMQVAEHASAEEVKAAYRRLVKIYHPDRAHEFVQASNTEVLKIINEAYQTLLRRSDPPA